jgi:hypothetical protein
VKAVATLNGATLEFHSKASKVKMPNSSGTYLLIGSANASDKGLAREVGSGGRLPQLVKGETSVSLLVPTSASMVVDYEKLERKVMQEGERLGIIKNVEVPLFLLFFSFSPFLR